MPRNSHSIGSGLSCACATGSERRPPSPLGGERATPSLVATCSMRLSPVMLTPRSGRWVRSIGHRRLRTVAVSLARCGSPTPCDSERRSGGDAIGADTADAASEKSSSVCEGASREGRATGIPVGTGAGLELPTAGCPHGVRDENCDRRGPDWHRVQTPVLVVRCGVDAPSRRADETRGTGATGGRPRPWREIAHLPGRIAGSRDAGKRDQGGRPAHVADRRTVVGHLGAPREATPAFSVWDAHRRLGPLVRVCSAVASTGVPPVVLGAADPRPDAIWTSVSGSAPPVMELIWTYARRTAPRGPPSPRHGGPGVRTIWGGPHLDRLRVACAALLCGFGAEVEVVLRSWRASPGHRQRRAHAREPCCSDDRGRSVHRPDLPPPHSGWVHHVTDRRLPLGLGPKRSPIRTPAMAPRHGRRWTVQSVRPPAGGFSSGTSTARGENNPSPICGMNARCEGFRHVDRVWPRC